MEEKGGDFERLSGELHSTVFRVSVSESRSVVGCAWKQALSVALPG
mgnify:CR=1 FL=1